MNFSQMNKETRSRLQVSISRQKVWSFLREKKTTVFTLTLVQGARHLIQSQLGGVPHESLILLALPP